MSDSYPKVRYSPLIPTRVSIISTVRGKRPKILRATDMESSKGVFCPFCPGNESVTPPATLALRKVNDELIYDREVGDERFKDWVVRIVPNKYPAFMHDVSKEEVPDLAYGYHEVIIESRHHDKQPPDMELGELVLMFKTLFKRVKEIFDSGDIEYLIIIRNYGSRAGASIPHPHMQLFASKDLIPVIREEAETFKNAKDRGAECPLCSELRRVVEDGRLVYGNELFTVFTSWAPRQPYELWISPKRHEDSPLNYSDEELRSLADAFREALRLYKYCLNDPAYNLWFHLPPKSELGKGHFHWHIEIEPVIATWGGLERGGGAYIVTVSPEDAARELRSCREKTKTSY